ncbi:hypothetical protein PM082_023937 [Marasmius tenuissimus]|nr:hypothetical protein PM082_023937 [Marasmius tenuissimus]
MGSFWKVLDTGEENETENSMPGSDYMESGATTPRHFKSPVPPACEPRQEQLHTGERERKKFQEEEQPVTETDTDNQVDELDSSEVEDELSTLNEMTLDGLFAVRGMEVEDPCVRCTAQNLTCLAQVGSTRGSCVEYRNDKTKCSLMMTNPLSPTKQKKEEEEEDDEQKERQDDHAQELGAAYQEFWATISPTLLALIVIERDFS